MIIEYWRIIRQLSIIKTIRFNIHYFGLISLVKYGPFCFIAKNVKFSCMKGKVIVHNPEKDRIRLGFGTDIPIFDRRYERFIWHNNGTIVFHKHGEIRLGCRIDNEGFMEFGENVCCNASTTFICKRKIIIGNQCGISWRTLFMDTDYHYIFDEDGNIINKDHEINISDCVWISCNVTILKGTEINSKSIIAAGAIISGKKYEEKNIIIAGNGKIIKRNITWEDHLPE